MVVADVALSVVVSNAVCFVDDAVVSGIVAAAVPLDVVGDVVCLDVDVVSLVDIPSVMAVAVVWSSTIDRVDPGVVVSVVGGDVVP